MKSKKKEVSSACITECRIETNCPRGGDSGHGGRTVFELTDLGSTDFSVIIKDEFGNSRQFDSFKTIQIVLGGDCEAENLCKLLKFAAYELENMIEENAEERSLELLKDHVKDNQKKSEG